MNQEMNWDHLLGIRTTGRDASISNHMNYPYEPTSYEVLERLANSGYIGKQDTLLDYGCGKGRVEFFLSYQTRCHAIGIDYDERMIGSALENLQTAGKGERVQFICENATTYTVPMEVNRCYFFHPFAVEILAGAVARILDSYYENPREIYLFFYYPSEEYVAFLMQQDALMFEDEMDCSEWFDKEDPRERILVFKIEE